MYKYKATVSELQRSFCCIHCNSTTEEDMLVCVSDVGESLIKQSVTAVAALSHSGVDRHKQAHTRTHTHTF